MYARIMVGERMFLQMLGRTFLCSLLLAGGLLSATSARAATYNFGYDNLGRLTGVSDSSGNVAGYSYDAAGNITSITRNTAAVSILQFSPQSGPVGSTVTISGSGYSSTASQNSVTFNGTAASITSASATQLVVQVPTGATTGAISVSSPGGSATSSAAFSVGQGMAPTITGFSPTVGVAGSSVSVSGTNFQTVLNENNLTFNTRVAPVSAATASSLTTSVPTLSTSGKLAVTTPNGRATSTQDFFVPPPPHVAADVTQAGRMTIGGTQTVSIATAAKIGLILFDAIGGQKIRLKITSSSFSSCSNGAIQLIQPDGSAGSNINLCNGTLLDTTSLPLTGTYTLMVAPSGSDTGSISFTLSSVPANVTGTISPGGASTTLTTTTPGQDGSLTFSGTAGARISLLTSQDTMGWYNIAILSPSGTSLYSNHFSGGLFVDPITLPATGIYTIYLGHDGDSTGSLTFTLYSVPPDATGTVTVDGSSATVSTTAPGQDGKVSFSGTAGQRVNINQSASACYFLTVLNPDGTSLYSRSYTCGSSTVGPLTLPAAGTYTILAGHSGTTTGSYTFTVTTVPTTVTGTISIGGSPVTLTTTVAGQDGQLTFSGTAGQKVSLATSQDTMGCYYLNLKNPDGSNLYFQQFLCGSASTGTLTLPATGTYTINLIHNGNSTGSLTFTLSSVP